MGERLTCDAGQAAGPALLTEEQAAFALQQLAGDYGMAAVRAKWEGLTPLQVKANLAKRLGMFSWASILRALDVAPRRYPDFPPNTGQLAALCESFEPVPMHKALPAPNLTPEQIAERQAAAEAMARKVAAPRYDFKAWARKLRAEWLSGRNLGMQQQVMGAEALGERWHMDNGRRECSPIYDAEAA